MLYIVQNATIFDTTKLAQRKLSKYTAHYMSKLLPWLWNVHMVWVNRFMHS